MMKVRKRMITVISRTLALVIVLGFFVNAGYAQEKGKSAGNEAIAQLYAGAKKEGTVIIWGHRSAGFHRGGRDMVGCRRARGQRARSSECRAQGL